MVSLHNYCNRSNHDHVVLEPHIFSHIPMHTSRQGLASVETGYLYQFGCFSVGNLDLEHGPRLHNPLPTGDTRIETSDGT